MEIYYSIDEDPEVLSHQDIDEVVESWANDYWRVERLPEELEIFEWHPKPMRTPEDIAESVLENIIERLDEEYQYDIYADGTEPCSEMKNAALVFAQVVAKEYPNNAWAVKKSFKVNPRKHLSKDLHHMGFNDPAMKTA